MSTSEDALRILDSYVRRTRSARVPYASLVSYAEKYLARAADSDTDLRDFADNTSNMMAAHLVDLEQKGNLKLTYDDGTITTVSYPGYYANTLAALYERIEDQPDRPFPSDDALSPPIPLEMIRVVDVRTEFIRWFTRAESGSGPDVLRLVFPDGILPMLIPLDQLVRLLPKLAVQKLRAYLRSERNASYIRSKLASIFRQREVAMKDMLNSILTTPEQALKSVFNPTDFTFHFWTQLSTTLIKEYSRKKDKLPEEHGYCQAAYLIGYYNIHFRGVQQREREREGAIRQLENRLRQRPYAYTISAIQAFTDQKGIALTRKCSVEDVNGYIAERITPTDADTLPEMLRIRCADGNEYYVYRDYVPHVTMEHMFTARREIRDFYMDSWKACLQQHGRLDEMRDDAVFEQSVAGRLREGYPLLHTLLNYNLLYLARKESQVAPELDAELAEVFHPKEARLRPILEILNLDRRKILADVRLLLPFWLAVPLISSFVLLVKRFFLGVPAEERFVRKRSRRRSRMRTGVGLAEPASTTLRYASEQPAFAPSEGPGAADRESAPVSPVSRRAQVARFKSEIQELQRHYVQPGSTPERVLDELAERWNPLLDPVAKGHLIEDVNSLARDFLRRMKVGFRLVPPSRERVEEWADRLSRNEVFAQIRRRDDLKQYLKLYMLTVLGK